MKHVLCGIGVALAMGASLATANAETTLIFNNFVPTGSVYYTHGILPFKEAVEAGTEGRVKIEITTATLAPPGGQFEMVQSGIADLAIFSPSFLGNKILLPNVASLPFSGVSAEAGSVALWRTYDKYFRDANEFAGVKLLGLMRFRSKVLFTSDREVTSLPDIAGLKVQVVPGAGAEVLKVLGATPIPHPQVQAHELLNSGVIDGTLTEFLAVVGFKADGEVEHILEFPDGIVASVLSLLINEDRFAELSPEDQQVVLDAAGETFARTLGSELDALTPALRDKMVEQGKTLNEAGSEFLAPVRDGLVELETNWIAEADGRGVDGRAARDYYLEQYQAVASQ